MHKLIAVILWLTILCAQLWAQGLPQFRADDPLWVDPDENPVPQPERVRLSQIYDLVENTFIRRLRQNEKVAPAVNVNTLGGVPDSSWFTNRIGRDVLSIDELVTGPNQSTGPDQTEPWTVIAAKTEGVTPGFTVRDGRGEVYFIKLDPPSYPRLMTSTEVVVTKFFHAFGYNVPENYLATIRRDQLVIGADALMADEEGKERRLTNRDMNRIFEKVYQAPDGTTPVVASRMLTGTPVGPFKYLDTRMDDPNDIFQHEDRRELRALRLFSAWLNHDDSRSVNTLDMYVGEPGKGYVKHYLIDFGSCLGSGSIKPQSKRAGNEYIIEWPPILKAALSMGIWDRPWRKVKYPDYPSVGRFEGDFFEPELWRPEYPNPAFDRMLPQDAFWAVRIILRFTDEMIRALVETGHYANRETERYLTETIIKRRDKIVQHYLARIDSLDEFSVTRQDGTVALIFHNLASEVGLAPDGPYQYLWFRYSNGPGKLEKLRESGSSPRAALPLPNDNSEFLMVRITPPEQPSIDVYLRNRQGNFQVVGLDRKVESEKGS